MCAILGLYETERISEEAAALFSESLSSMKHRGPDDHGFFRDTHILLGHRRLSIIDLSPAGHQPMHTADGSMTIVFNGEIFNFSELRQELVSKGHTFRSESDTEVLLQLYQRDGAACLNRLNGFFAFAIYHHQEQRLFIARDRYGIKPLYYYLDKNRLLFGSELSAIKKQLPNVSVDPLSLQIFLQLAYIPEPYAIYTRVQKLEAGHYLQVSISEGEIKADEHQWYELPEKATYSTRDYDEVCKLLFEKMDAAVARRLISDVPLGCFLSGGVDSSIITALASRHTPNLHTYSIGFKNDAYFDETQYSELVARHCGTRHTVFRLDDDAFSEALPEFQKYIDEPFADSSALAVYILNRETRQHVTVSLSGDGSDELFAGYNKHKAEYKLRRLGAGKHIVQLASFLLKSNKGSRNSTLGNYIRQLHRLSDGASENIQGRYWKWCCINDADGASGLLTKEFQASSTQLIAAQRSLTRYLEHSNDFNDVLRNDCKMLLPGDMLRKVDLMSMANSLEVRVPFLDYEVVDLAFRMPSSFKIDGTSQKKILRDTFGSLLPADIFTRKKQGFEIPLASIYRGKFRKQIEELLSPSVLQAQGIFDQTAVNKLLHRVYSDQPGEANAQLWTLLTFQFWWQHKHLS